MEIYDLAIAYKWIYDRELTDRIEGMFQSNGFSTFIIGTHNVDEIANRIIKNDLRFVAFLDRASDEDPLFNDIASMLNKSDTYIINNYKNVENAIRKAKMHLKLKRLGIKVPKTYIVPQYDLEAEINIASNLLRKLGFPFVIKPSYYTGAGDGVIVDATSVNQINEERKKLPDDQFLIQEKIYPVYSDSRRVWFRSFWFFNAAFPVWWDDLTHIYEEVSQHDYHLFKLDRLVKLTQTLYELTGMDYFSTEATIDKSNDFILIDYVNDQCDFRSKLIHFDGVPESIINNFILRMMEKIAQIKKAYHLQ